MRFDRTARERQDEENFRKSVYTYQIKKDNKLIDFDFDKETELLNDFEYAKDKIVFDVYRYDDKNEKLNSTLHKRIADMVMVYFIRYECGKDEVFIGVPDNSDMIWGVSNTDIFNQAMENTMKVYPMYFENAVEMVRKEDEKRFKEEYVGEDLNSNLYSITSRNKGHGAGIAFYPGALKQVCESIGATGLYIIFASKNFILAFDDQTGIYNIPATDKNFKEKVGAIIFMNNHCEQCDEEILSDRLFHYNLESDVLVDICTPKEVKDYLEKEKALGKSE